MSLISFTDKGLYCAAGDFYIDPWQPVHYAVITHAHSDHARPGNTKYLCHPLTLPVLQLRLGATIHAETVDWQKTITRNGVKISLHPAGHIIGSAQVRIEKNGEVWAVSGDYKTEDDGISTPFEPVACNTFITESTFGLPIYNWKKQAAIFTDIQNWILKNQAQGKASVLTAYSLGKAQRLLNCVAAVTPNIFVHGAIWNVQQALTGAGIVLPAIQKVNADIPREAYKNAVIIAPPGAEGSAWIKKFTPYRLGICSGWMQVRGNIRRRNADAGFALSDHADWNGLLSAVKATGAEKVFVTHGFQSAFSRYLTENGIPAAEVKTAYGNEEDEKIITNADQPEDETGENT